MQAVARVSMSLYCIKIASGHEVRAFLRTKRIICCVTIDAVASRCLTSLQTFAVITLVGPGGPMPRDHRRRYALVGAGARAEMFVRAITGDHAGTAELVALADVNRSRMEAHNRWLKAAGHEPVPTYAADDLGPLLDREQVDELIVTSVDRTHAGHIVTALEAGCDVLTEKPMTVDAASARRILDAQRRTGKKVSVAFNYRFNPVHEV